MSYSLKIVKAPSLNLAVPCVYIKLPNQKLMDLAKKAALQMYENAGIGLAAPQIGYNIAMMLLSSDIEKMKPNLPEGARLQLENNKWCYVLVNPKIRASSDKLVDLFKGEGCLSLPIKDTGRVDRYEQIDVEYDDLHGQHYSQTLTAHVATIIQHEADHLYGVLFPARMKSKERDILLTKYSAYNAIKYEEMDRFKELIITNAARSNFLQKNQEYIDPLFDNIDAMKAFCAKNKIDDAEITARIEEIFAN